MSSTPACATESGAARLLQARTAALQQGDFAAVYASYHASAPFLRLFPDVASYREFGRSILSTSVRLLTCEVLREECDAQQARLLICQTFILDGETFRQLELVVCLPTVDGWRYRSGLKLNGERLPEKLQDASWDELEAAGDGLWL